MSVTQAQHGEQESRLSAIWQSRAEQYEQVGDVRWAVDALLAHLQGRARTGLEDRLTSLSAAAKAVISSKLASRLTFEAHRLIDEDLKRLSSPQQPSADVAVALSSIAGVYTRWKHCCEVIDNGASSSSSSHAFPHWLHVRLQATYPTIEESIYNDLASYQSSNAFQTSLEAMGLTVQYVHLVNRAAQRLTSDRIKAVELDEDFDEAALPKLQMWLQSNLIATLGQWRMSQIDSISSRLDHDICTELGHIRSRQLFDIIKDFPLSTPALQDLNACAEQCKLQPYISRQLSLSLKARLLHPGASTKDIIQFYTHLIRALRFIDPSGVILSHVIGPVRTYLRARPDTISVIVASLLGQAGSFTLLRDMMRETDETQGLNAADTSLLVYDEEEDVGNSVAVNSMAGDESKRMLVLPSPDEQDWAPRPIDAGPDYRQSRKSDVIAIIVSIFDDEEGFVAALEKSCAEQLVKVEGYNTSKEYETNENLKKRFGDAPLSRCDVMLNDVRKSQRFDRAVHTQQQDLPSSPKDKSRAFHSLHPFILSRQFWPALKEAAPVQAVSTSSMFGSIPVSAPSVGGVAAGSAAVNVKMPGQFATAMEQYQESFKKLAPMRRLRWLNARSSVLLELEMNDGRRIKERVTPLQAAVVELAAGINASRQQPLSLSLLQTELQVDNKAAIAEALTFWSAKGVLRPVNEDPTLYEIVEDINN